MGRRYDTISLLTDVGHGDESVGVFHAIAADLAPTVRVIDLCHESPTDDVRAAGMMLARSVSYLPEGVIVACVGTSIGDGKRYIAAEVADGAAILLGPDNGVLAPAVAMAGGAGRCATIDNEALWLPSMGAHWPLRDRLLPAAAHLCGGGELADLGADLDPYAVQPGVVALSRAEADGIVGAVMRVDRRGNCQTNIDPDDLAAWGAQLMVRVPGDREITRVAHRVAHGPGVAGLALDRLGPGSIGYITDAHGLVTLIAGRRSAAEELGVADNAPIVLSPLDEAEQAGGSTTAIHLRPKPSTDSPQ